MSDMDTPENRVKLPADFAASVRTLGRRATFMAAFTYYQIGRYMYAGPDTPSVPYIFFNTAAFLGSTVHAGVSVVFLYYLARLKTTDEKFDFCLRRLTQARLASRLYFFVVILYTVGIGLMGFQYYPDNVMKYIVLALMLAGLLFYIHGIRVVTVNQLSLQSNFEHVKENYSSTDPDAVVAQSKYGKKAGQKHEEYILNEATVISGRAQFIAGLAQFGILRYCPYPFCTTARNVASDLFAFFASLACALSFCAGNILAHVSIFLPDTLKDKQLAMAILCTDITHQSFQLYIGALFSLLLSIVFCGWGTETPVRYDPIFYLFGISGFLWVLTMLLRSYQTHQILEEEENEKLKDYTAESFAALENTTEAKRDEAAVKATLIRCNGAGAMATFAAGYLNYNLCTMQTDVFALSYVEEKSDSARGFVSFNVISVTLAFVACVLDSILTQFTSDFRTSEYKVKFLQSQQLISNSCSILYNLTLFTWFWVFALIGLVKYNRVSYIPFSYAVVGMVGLLSGMLYLRNKFNSSTTYDGGDKNEAGGVVDEQSVAVSRPSNLGGIAFSVIFLGGYAYYNVLFFNFRGRQHETAYLHAMSLCFMVSMWIMVLSDGYNSAMSLITSFRQKKTFARMTFPFYLCMVAMSYICVFALLVGLSFVGYIKPTTVDMVMENSVILLVGATTTIVLSIPTIYWMASTFRSISSTDYNSKETRKITSNVPLQSEEAAIYGEDYHTIFNEQLSEEAWTAGFIAGNVCYEILFTDLVSENISINAFYMIFLTASFACSLAAVLMAITAMLAFGELRTTQAKLAFAVRIRYVKKLAFIYSFGSLFTWLCASCFMAEAKYSGQKKIAWPSCVLGPVSVVFLSYILYILKTDSDYVQAKWKLNKNAEMSAPNDEYSILKYFNLIFFIGVGASDRVKLLEKKKRSWKDFFMQVVC